MKRKAFVGKILAIVTKATITLKKRSILGVIIAMMLIATMQSATCNFDQNKRTVDNQPAMPQTFRLLAIEGTFSGGVRPQSAQYLIWKLIQYPNWSNMTHTSYIHLLSRYVQSEIIDEAKSSFIGNSTKEKVRDEILNFLGNATSNELVVFYCTTDGLALELYLDEIISANELTDWLSVIRGTLCVILDSCHSGSFSSDGQASMLGSQRIILCSSRSDQLSRGESNPYWGGDFTGFESIYYAANKTYISLGLIGAMNASSNTDVNKDGWLSALEMFQFANSSILQFWHHQDPVYFNDLPEDPLLIQLHLPQPPVASFNYSPENPKVNESISFNASASYDPDGTIVNYQWDFGDGNITTATIPYMRHMYSQPGNYIVTCNVTDNQDLWNTTSSIINVRAILQGDINDDGTVDIYDAIILAGAYNSKLGDPNWIAAADINSDSIVDIYDAIILANHYGETT